MKIFFPKTAVFSFVALALTACGGSNSSSNQAQAPKQNPTLKTLEKEGKLAIGTTLKAKSTCEDCEGFETVYTWVIDKNNNGIFDDTVEVDGENVTDSVVKAKEYTLVEEDLGLRVKLEAYLAKTDGSQKTESEYVEYQPSIVQDTTSIHNWNSYVLKTDGSIVYENSLNTHKEILSEKFKAVYSDYGYFLAEQEDGSVVTWGRDIRIPKEILPKLKNNIETVLFNAELVGVLTKEGQVFSWFIHDTNERPGNEYTDIPGEIESGIKSIYANQYAFAALKNDGSLITWGYHISGGKLPEGASKGVTNVVAHGGGFSAITTEQSALTWGSFNIFPPHPDRPTDEISAISTLMTPSSSFSKNIKSIHGVISCTFSPCNKVIASNVDGSIISWGNNEGEVIYPANPSKKVQEVFVDGSSVFILFENGSMEVLGRLEDDYSVNNVLKDIQNVQGVIASTYRNAAIKLESDEVILIGDPTYTSVSDQFKEKSLKEGVKELAFNTFHGYIAVLKEDGSVNLWNSGSRKLIKVGSTTKKYIRLDSRHSHTVAQGVDGSVSGWIARNNLRFDPTRNFKEFMSKKEIQPTEIKTSSLK
ncbi:WD40 repeat domain-containing protein [Algicola sagamiensis]|uniref:WD40 repeat domain-containing protein n=1 Tax=Algicola sagamiensis TaxID=163869 RepID=UPI00037624D9|nr:WD40 repeat domain-containing protein [Algicola sagamiensis]